MILWVISIRSVLGDSGEAAKLNVKIRLNQKTGNRARIRPAGRSAAWLAILAVLAVAGGLTLRQRAPETGLATVRAIPPRTGMGLARSAAVPERLIYPYSIVPGGVATPQEVSEAVAADPVVKAHYQGFRMTKATAQTVEKARQVHVSYRIGNKVYWTKKKVRLAAGERVLTDGATTLRARCGNQVSEKAQHPTHPNEPTEAALDTPALAPQRAL